MITAADEDAIRQVPAGAWQPGTAQDGTAEDDKDDLDTVHREHAVVETSGVHHSRNRAAAQSVSEPQAR